jgi:hypothetical protein
LPTVTLTAPPGGSTFTAPASIAIQASASDPENQLVRVEFYSGATLLGSDTTAPYTFAWSNVPAGSYTLTARAYDAAGASATSASVAVSVAAPPAPQTWRVAFTASSNHADAVTSYLLEVYPQGVIPGSQAPAHSSDLGKPVPAANGEIVVDRTAFLSSLAGGNYTITLQAIGPGGTARSQAVSFSR